MNLRTVAIDRIRRNEGLDNSSDNHLKDMGFIDHKRTIQLFIKEIEKINGIPDRKVQEIAALITNYSIADIDSASRLYNKTVYFCDVEFPKDLDMRAIMNNIEQFIEVAYIRPTYAFQTAHVVKSDSCINLGLTMADLTIPGTCGIVNFADNKGEFPKFKDQIYSNTYNPKFYNRIDGAYDQEKKRSGNINEFVDDRTKIFCNSFGSTTVENFINNEAKTGIYINNRTRTLNEFINDMFQKLLYIGLEKFELIIRKTNGKIEFNVTKCGFYAKFDERMKEEYIEEILTTCEKQLPILNVKLEEDFHMIYSFDTSFTFLDYYYGENGENKEVRISKPVYHLYNEYSIETESIIENVELNGTIAKFDLLETVEKEARLNLENQNRDIKDMISIVDSATQVLLDQIENSNSDRARLSLDDKLWQRNLLDQK